jgi:iron complex transport system ATP-binding protein
VIQCNALSVRLGLRLAVDRATIPILPGRVTVVIGPNGAGKTSLLRAIAGLVQPCAGSVTLDGREIASIEPGARARRIGYLPQNGSPAWNLAGRELVSLGRLPHHDWRAGRSETDDAAIDAALAATDTVHLADRRLKEMSGGELARVRMARVLAGRPDWILADEPLANLDPPHQRDILALFRESAAAGTGVIIILHQLNAAARVADDVVLMREARVIASGVRELTLTPEQLEQTFAMPFRMVFDGEDRAILPQP